MVRPVTATRERILAAAYARFSHYGFRRTSMEDIAAEAGISRASLYTSFENKEEIFRSLAQQFHDEAAAGVEAALELEAPLAARLQAAVEAKTLRLVEIAFSSPHGVELIDENSRLCGGMASDSESRFRNVMAQMLRQASQDGEIDLAKAGLAAAEVAELIARSISGLKAPGLTVALYRKRVVALLKLFVAGLGAATKSPPAKRAARPARAVRKPARRGK